MLTLFLLGLVAGSLLLAKLELRITNPLTALAMVQLGAGVWVAASVVWLPALLSPAREGSGFGAFVLNGFLRAAPMVIPPTILSGMALPLAIRVFSSSLGRAGADVGIVYAANTLGAIAGAMGTALVLLPVLGASRALALLAGVGAPRRRQAWFAVAVAVACAAAVFAPTEPVTRAFSKAGRAAPRGRPSSTARGLPTPSRSCGATTGSATPTRRA